MRFESEWQATLELDGETIEGLFPVLDGHRPFFRGLFDGQVGDLEGGTVTREDPPVIDRLANHAVERFNGVGGVDRPADVFRVVKNRDDLLSMT